MKLQLLDALIKISEEINANVDLDMLLPAIVKITEDYLQVHNASITLVNNNHVTTNRYTALSNKADCFLPSDVIEDIVANKTEYIFNEKDLNYRFHKPFIALPLNAGGSILGAFILTDKENNNFSEDDISIAKYIASQCALAIERNQIYDTMRASKNLQSIGKLTSSIAHDISNLLGIADVYLALMEETVGGDMSIEEYLVAVKSEIKRVNVLVKDMLDLSKEKLEIHKTVFNVAELVKELKLYTIALMKGTDISISYKVVGNIEMNADKNRLFRVFFNLINNSADALEGRGYMLMKVKQIGNDVVFTVFDTGKGIPEENIVKLFQPFFTSGKVNGTGLGLSIVEDIIKAHKGTIRVRSCVNKYTCFIIRIPVNG